MGSSGNGSSAPLLLAGIYDSDYNEPGAKGHEALTPPPATTFCLDYYFCCCLPYLLVFFVVFEKTLQLIKTLQIRLLFLTVLTGVVFHTTVVTSKRGQK